MQFCRRRLDIMRKLVLHRPLDWIFYQAGVVVLSGSIFMSGAFGLHGTSMGLLGCDGLGSAFGSGSNTFDNVLTGTAISGACNYFRHRIYDMSFKQHNRIKLDDSLLSYQS